MSVFKLQEWWSVKLADDEEFDNGGMIIGNLDNSSTDHAKIAVGSLRGMLRVYYPTKPSYRIEDLIFEEQMEAPVLQMLVGKFIPSSPRSNGIAILHPKKLVVYELAPVGSSKITHYTLTKVYQHVLGDGDGKHFTAYAMIAGHFGGSNKGREMILVQSMDGKIQIFEQSAHAFTRQFNDSLLPGPMLYLPNMDAFLNCNYAARVECYRYQVLASLQNEIPSTHTHDSKEDDDDHNGRSRVADRGRDEGRGKKGPGNITSTIGFGLLAVRSALVEWSTNVGESVRQVVRGKFSTNLTSTVNEPVTSFYKKNRTRDESAPASAATTTGGQSFGGGGDEVLVLCDKSMFLIKESGAIIQQRRLEHDAVCMCAYTPDGGKGEHIMVATEEGTIQIFVDFTLRWAAKVPIAPVQIQVAQFASQKGLIVTLDDSGQLNIGYLGTKPPVNAVSLSGGQNAASSGRDMDYDKIDEEHRRLLQIIRESQSDKKAEPKDKLVLRVQIPKTLDRDMHAGVLEATSSPPKDLVQVENGGDGRGHVKICVRVAISCTGEEPCTNVCLTPHVPSFVYAAPVNMTFENIAGNSATPLLVKFYFYARAGQIPTDLNGQITATYTTPSGEARVMVYPLQLPIWLACRVRPAVKQAAFKFTLGPDFGSGNSDPADSPVLSELFDDMLYATEESGVNVGDMLGSMAAYALGFEYYYTNRGENSNLSDSATAGTSILLSKQTGRYRVQSDMLSSALLVTSELERRLLVKTGKDASSGIVVPAITFNDTLPLDGFFDAINRHFSTRARYVCFLLLWLHLSFGCEFTHSMLFSLSLSVYTRMYYRLADLSSQLNDNSHQFRIVQKRLLVRYKDRNPAPLNGLEIIMEDSYNALIALGDEIEMLTATLQQQSTVLTCQSKLMVALCAMKYQMSAEDSKLLESYFCPTLRDGQEQGWEETIEASTTFLLKTCLAKNVKESASLSNVVLEMPANTDRLLKHIAMVFDRIGKGARLVSTPPQVYDDAPMRNESKA